MRIDAHGHACGVYATLESLIAKLDQNGIDKVVLFPGEVGNRRNTRVTDRRNKEVLYLTNVVGEFYARFVDISDKIDFGNQYVWYLRRLAPQRVIQFYWLTPKYLPSLGSDFARMAFSGIKLHQCIRYFGIKSEFFRTVFDFAEVNRLPLIIHLYGKKDACDLIDMVKGRGATVIVSHLLFYRIFDRSWDEIQRNLYFDVANYYFINRASIEYAIQRFGPQKLIFGSDTIFGENCIERTIDLVESLDIAARDKELILGENMRMILGIG